MAMNHAVLAFLFGAVAFMATADSPACAAVRDANGDLRPGNPECAKVTNYPLVKDELG